MLASHDKHLVGQTACWDNHTYVTEFGGTNCLFIVHDKHLNQFWSVPLLWLELARDALHSEGYHVIAAYMSPVSDAYKKQVYMFFHSIHRGLLEF